MSSSNQQRKVFPLPITLNNQQIENTPQADLVLSLPGLKTRYSSDTTKHTRNKSHGHKRAATGVLFEGLLPPQKEEFDEHLNSLSPPSPEQVQRLSTNLFASQPGLIRFSHNSSNPVSRFNSREGSKENSVHSFPPGVVQEDDVDSPQGIQTESAGRSGEQPIISKVSAHTPGVRSMSLATSPLASRIVSLKAGIFKFEPPEFGVLGYIRIFAIHNDNKNYNVVKNLHRHMKAKTAFEVSESKKDKENEKEQTLLKDLANMASKALGQEGGCRFWNQKKIELTDKESVFCQNIANIHPKKPKATRELAISAMREEYYKIYAEADTKIQNRMHSVSKKSMISPLSPHG